MNVLPNSQDGRAAYVLALRYLATHRDLIAREFVANLDYWRTGLLRDHETTAVAFYRHVDEYAQPRALVMAQQAGIDVMEISPLEQDAPALARPISDLFSQRVSRNVGNVIEQEIIRFLSASLVRWHHRMHLHMRLYVLALDELIEYFEGRMPTAKTLYPWFVLAREDFCRQHPDLVEVLDQRGVFGLAESPQAAANYISTAYRSTSPYHWLYGSLWDQTQRKPLS